MNRALSLIILILSCTHVFAKNSVYLTQVSLDDGLSQADVTQIMQDSDGFIWFGTQQGLNRFDGHRIKLISGPDHILEIQQIDSIFEDSQKRIWVGSVPNRNFRIDKTTNIISEIYPPFPENREVQDSAFLEMYEDNNGILWLSTLRAIFRYDTKTDQMEFFVDFEPTLEPTRHLIRGLRAFNNYLLVTTSNGFFAVNLASKAIKEIPFNRQFETLPNEILSNEEDDRLNVKGIYQNQQGNILIGTVEGLYEIDSQSLKQFLSGTSKHVATKVLDPTLNIWELIEEANYYWLATNAGLVKMQKSGEQELIFAYSETAFDSADNNIPSMLKDNEGNLWLGSRNDGAFMWQPSNDAFEYFQQGVSSKSISHNRVWSSIEDPQGNIWVGTQNGLNVIDKSSQEVTQYYLNLDNKAVVSNSTIFDLEIQGNKLWALSVEGIRKIDISTRQEETIFLSKEAKEILINSAADIFVVDANNLGVVSEDGIYTLDTQSGDIFLNESTKNDGKLKNRLLQILGSRPDNKNVKVVSMVDKVVTYAIDTGVIKPLHALPPSDAPRTTAQDVYINDTHTWIAYPGFGIYIIDNNTGEEVKIISSLDGLPDNSPLQFRDDKEGNIWVTSNSGLIRFDKDTFHFRVFDRTDGLSTNEFNGGASTTTKDGVFYFGSIKGVMKVDPRKLARKRTNFDLHNHITNISLMSRELAVTYGPLVNTNLEIGHKDYGLKLEYSALSFSNPKKLRYKYWLDGSSKTTPTITSENELFLPKLEPGESIFNVSVIDYETGKESQPEQLYLKVLPHPAFSWWAYIIYITLLMSFSLVIYGQRRKRQLALLKAHEILTTNEERLQLALTSSDSGLWDWQSSDNQIFETRKAKNSKQEDKYYDFDIRINKIHQQDQEKYREAWAKFIDGKEEVFDVVYRWQELNGSWAWYRDLARVTERDINNNPTRVTGTYTDITSIKDDQEKVALFSEAFQSTRDIVVITDKKLCVRAANSAFYRMTDFKDDEILEKPLEALKHPDNTTCVSRKLLESLEGFDYWEGEGLLQRLNRPPLHVLITANAFTSEQNATRFVLAITDISQQKEAEIKLRKLANYDTLTGLPNRALLIDRISHALANALRNKQQMALFFIDLDRFKQVNDSLGHDVGDLLLINVALVLRSCTRKSDTVARLGGDEFVIMLEDIDSIESISRIAQSILDAMSAPFQLGQHEVSASPSIGISIYPNDGENSEDLFKHADVAMYHAKDAGRNNFKFFTPEMNAKAVERLNFENDLRAAIKNKEITYFYQPKIDLINEQVTGFECLARWQKPNGQMVQPNDFIPLAEELGLIIDMTESLIEEALQVIQRWNREGIETCFAINLSARHLHHYDLPTFIQNKLEEYQVSPRAIEFELTGSTIMENMDNAVELLDDLSKKGIAISLDDFGTGYTSFQYLKDFPIRALKIDRSFVKDIGQDLKDEAIIDSIIILANKLNIQTVAEGVETKEQAAYLRQRGCPIAQGFLYSKPVSVSHAFKLVTAKAIDS